MKAPNHGAEKRKVETEDQCKESQQDAWSISNLSTGP